MYINIMPCYEPRDNEQYQRGYNAAVTHSAHHPGDISQISQLTEQNKKLEASLCAIITELENKGIVYDVISQASKSGLIDLMKFWSEHSKEDEARIAYRLHQFSEHEQEIIKKILK